MKKMSEPTSSRGHTTSTTTLKLYILVCITCGLFKPTCFPFDQIHHTSKKLDSFNELYSTMILTSFLYTGGGPSLLKCPALHHQIDPWWQNCIACLCTLPHLWIEKNLSRNSQRNIVIMKSIPKHRTTQNLRDNHRHKHKKSW